MSLSGDRAVFAEIVAATAGRWGTDATIRAGLERQTPYERDARRVGLDALSTLLKRRLACGEGDLDADIQTLGREFGAEPLVQLYAFAIYREAGEDDGARASLDALLGVDPDDPMALHFDALLRSRPIATASEETRLSNIAKLAATPLLANPYSLAVGVIFDAIRHEETARVLDVGVGGGAQMARLLELLRERKHGVRRLEIVGLDHFREFLAAAGERIAAASEALAGKVEVRYQPVHASVEALVESDVRTIAGERLHAANASISLHEISGEAKLAALANLRRVAPATLVIAEWNYCLENVLAETSCEFVFNVRSVAAAMVAALRERHTIAEARAVVGDWLSQGKGQLTCAASARQECFLEIASWKALLEQSGFAVVPAEQRWLEHAAVREHASIDTSGWYVRTSDYGGATPIALLVGAPV